MQLTGTLVAGYQVASGTSTRDRRFPLGTIRMQAPFFAALGLDIESYFGGRHVWGSLNVDIAPLTFEQVGSDHFFKNIHWTDLQPAENFFFSYATVIFNGQRYKALFYNPDPATKPHHFHLSSNMEFIAEQIADVKYGDRLTVEIPDGHVIVKQSGTAQTAAS